MKRFVGLIFCFILSMSSLSALPSLFGKKSEPVEDPAPKKEEPRQRGDLSGGAIYWHARQSGIHYTNDAQSTFSAGDFTTTSLIGPDWGFDPGFTVGANYGFNRSNWSVGVEYLYFKGTAFGRSSVVGNFGMFPVLSFADDTLTSDYVTAAKMSWVLHLNLFDILCSYEWTYNSLFSLVPRAAFREVWIGERTHAIYTGGTYSAGDDDVRLTSGFYGMGPCIGLKPRLKLSEILSLYGDAGVAFLAGWFNVKQRETFVSVPRASLKRNFSGGRWNGEFGFGINFAHSFDRLWIKKIEADLGYDYVLFSGQYEYVHGPAFSPKKLGTTLTLYGVHASVGAHF